MCNIYFCAFFSLQYDFVELLDGSRLIAREQRNLLEAERAGRQIRSVSLHEAGFIQYLDAGIWHLAFYNDGKNAEQVSFNTIVIGKHTIFKNRKPEYFANKDIISFSPLDSLNVLHNI